MEGIIISIIILVFSVVIHEVSHGLVAEKLGDPTARLQGRLTLNPLPHIDPLNSVLLPAFLWWATKGALVFGAAKPVPVNYLNLRNPKRDMALVALAGPGSNLLIAILCALPLRFGLFNLSTLGGIFLLQAVLVNIVLAVFNLIPIPPLDGSKILAGILPDKYVPVLLSLERWGFVIILVFLLSGLLDFVLIPLLHFLAELLTGLKIF